MSAVRDPFFSVVIPTHKRPALLRQAVESVLAQTFADFEIVVSDDEVSDRPASGILDDLRTADRRIAVVANQGERGQVGNTNNGIRHARGRWIKLLHDDDLLHAGCLQRFHDVIMSLQADVRVGVACCRADTLTASGELRPWRREGHHHGVEIVPSRHVVLAMYLQEDIGSSVPTNICINRDLIVTHDGWMPGDQGFVSTVDTHWAILLAPLGDRLIINEALVAKRQESESITGTISDETLDREFQEIRALQFRAIPPDLRAPPLHVAQQAMWIRRSAHRLLKRRRPVEALSLAARAWDPRAWILAARTPLMRRFPGFFRRTRRIMPLG